MIRTQIQLSEDQATALKRMAADRGMSMAALVREAVGELIASEERELRWKRVLSVVGKYSSGLTDMAESHDEYLAEAFSDH